MWLNSLISPQCADPIVFEWAKEVGCAVCKELTNHIAIIFLGVCLRKMSQFWTKTTTKTLAQRTLTTPQK